MPGSIPKSAYPILSDVSSSVPESDYASPITNHTDENSNETSQESLIVNHAVIKIHESPSRPDTIVLNSNPQSGTKIMKKLTDPSPACSKIVVKGEGLFGPDKELPDGGKDSLCPAASPKPSASMIIAQQMEAVKGELHWNESQWKVTGELGKGGFGVVYKVRGAGRCSAIFILLIYYCSWHDRMLLSLVSQYVGMGRPLISLKLHCSFSLVLKKYGCRFSRVHGGEWRSPSRESSCR